MLGRMPINKFNINEPEIVVLKIYIGNGSRQEFSIYDPTSSMDGSVLV